jgi:ABC-type transport system substrate-binding protein
MTDVSRRTASLEAGGSHRVKRLVTAGIVTLVLLVSACAAADRHDVDPDAVPEEMRYGGTAIVTLPTDPPTFNGLVAVDLESMWIHQSLLSMPLIRYDVETRPQPWLAASWDTIRVASDTLELTFHLMPDRRRR